MFAPEKVAALVAGFAVVSGVAGAAEIIGSGATFPYPIYSKWAEAYQKATGNRVNHQSIGSAGRGAVDATVTFVTKS